MHPASRVASTARSAVTAARVARSSSAASAADEVVVGAALDRQRALPGGGQHLQRVEHLGHLVEPAEPGQPGAREHDASYSPARTLPIRVSTLPRTPTTSKPRPRACSWAARRGEPVPTRLPAGQLAQGQPVAGDDDVARVLAGGYGGERDAVGGGGRAGP